VTFPRFLVAPEALSGPHAVLTGPQLRHLRARRLRVGSKLVLADGAGRQRCGIVISVDRHQAVIQISDDQSAQRDSALHLTLAQALLKGDKLDWVIEKATELGVSEFVLFTCERTLGRAAGDRHVRWTRLAHSAAQQCQRSRLPAIAGPVSFADVIARRSEALRLFFWEEQRGGLARVHRQHPGPSSVLAVIGPEGGFSAEEAQCARAAGFHIAGLGPRILRAETAAVAVATLCQFLWGDLEACRTWKPPATNGSGP
jgi:16S rRNA (uracil1498-N3)-methyltransferase